jgi:hypothetical protein
VAIIALGLTCLGCLLLSLSQRRHYRRVFADESTYARRQRPLRWSGYAIVFLALWPCVLHSGVWIGLILWLSLVALAAFLQILLLTYRPRAAATSAAAGAALVALGLLL